MAFGATTRSRLVLFGGLYFAQGIPWGFVTIALVLRLSTLGVGPAEIGVIVATALLPWTFKVALGPVVDALAARGVGRRPLLLACEACMAVTVLALALLDPRAQRDLFLTLVFVNSLFAAMQDVLTDALAIAVLPGEERGRANGVMSAAKYAGTAAGGGGLVWVASQLGWPATHGAAAALLLIPATAVLLLREPRAPAAPMGPALRALVRELPRAFLLRTTLVAAPFVLVAGASDTFLYPLVVTKLRLGLGLSELRMSQIQTLTVATSVAGSLLGGWLADRLGRRRAIVVGAVGLALSHLAFGLSQPSLATLIAYVVGSGLTAGVLYASTLALCMDLTDPQLPATHFQAFMALLNVRLMWASRLGGHLAEQAAPLTMFVLAAAVELLPLVLLLALAPRPRPPGELPSNA